MGSATSDSTVTVDDNPSQRKATYFRSEIAVDNSSAGLSRDVTVRGVKFNGSADVMTTAARTFFLPPVQETFTYDDDGNLTSDGRWNYSWDAENRLTNMAAKAYSLPNSARKQLGFSYDYMGRRIQKVVSTWNGTVFATPVTTKFVYDGWNLLAELDADNGNAVKCSYMWGPDLSGSMQGAGGVGGLLTVTPNGNGTHFVNYDGNGNVVGLTDSTGSTSARYEYDPFGQTLRASGSAAGLNPVRFSTKYTDSESGLCYYGYRFYNAALGRWANRDPAEEKGGANLLGFLANNPQKYVDLLGLYPLDAKTCAQIDDYIRAYEKLIAYQKSVLANVEAYGVYDYEKGLKRLGFTTAGFSGEGATPNPDRGAAITEVINDIERDPYNTALRRTGVAIGIAGDMIHAIWSSPDTELTGGRRMLFKGELMVAEKGLQKFREIKRQCERCKVKPN